MKTYYVVADSPEEVEFGNWYGEFENALQEITEESSEKIYKVTIEEVKG